MKNCCTNLAATFVGISLTLVPLGHSQTQVQSLFGAFPGDQFGAEAANVGDIDADGFDDFAVGAPFNDTGANNAGQVIVYSGRTQQTLYTWNASAVSASYGRAIAAAGDINADGFGDVWIGAPRFGFAGTTAGEVELRSGANGQVLLTLAGTPGAGFGFSIAGGSDIDGDLVPDVVVGAPLDTTAGARAGAVYLFSGATGLPIRSHFGTAAQQGLGHAVLLWEDVDGDGRADYAIGSPTPWLSGNTSSVAAFRGIDGTPLWSPNSAAWNDMYGWSLARLGDVNGDGIAELLAGAPQDPGVGCGCNGRGFVRLLDGASGALIYQINGASSYAGLGWDLIALGDLNGNGFEDFAVSQPATEGCGGNTRDVLVREGLDGSPLATCSNPGGLGSNFGFSLAAVDANGDGLGDLVCGTPCENTVGSQAGAAHVFTVVRRPQVYCQAQTNSQGCVPYIASAGTPSAAQLIAFRIKAFNVLNNKSGILFYGFAPQQTPFLGGALCVKTPLTRTAAQSSGGNPPPVDCSGVFSIDFNDRVRTAVDPLLIAGEEIFCQYWSRDPASPSTSNLTDALAFYLSP
jgi:hypothetical protein